MNFQKIRDHLEQKIKPHLHKGGKYEKWYALYEAVDTFLYRPGLVTKSSGS